MCCTVDSGLLHIPNAQTNTRHVEDALQAIDYLRGGGATTALNLGVGHGASVREVLTTAEAVTGMPIDAVDSPRRSGDPAILVATCDRAGSVLDWSPQTTDLGDIIESAWRWESSGPPSPEG